MNKVYNTVWNESTGVWVVTSELTRKGGRRPRQIRRTALAGLIAGLLLPSAPALAVDYNNETLGNGGTSSSMSVSAGDTATDTTINGGGYQRVSSGGSATSTTVNGGSQSIYSGGSATDTTLNSGGYQYIHDSASATSTTVNNGNQYIYNGGSATDTTLNSGGYQHIHDSASATSTTVNGGSQYIYSGGSATDTTLNSGGYQGIYDSASATSTTVNGGSQYIYSGGSAVSTTVNGGYQTVYNGGSATNTTINTGGIQNISGGSVTDTTLNDGGEQNVESGGVAVNTVINSGGTQKVNSGGSVTDTTINSGGGQYVYVNGNVTKTTITDGGILQVDTGGSASQVTQNSGGAIVTNTSAVLSGTNDKGTFSIAGGSASNMLLENGGLLTVLVGHDASDTTVGSNGTLSVQSGGVLRGTTTLTDNGTLVGNVVQNKGNLYFLNNSAATFAGALTGSGTLTQEGGNTRFSGLLSQDGGITLQSGAAMTMDTLQANANVTTQSGTTLTLDNGSILTGSVTGDNTGAGDMTVRGASVWHLGGDSTVGALTLDNGTVDFRPSATTRLTQAFRPVSLVAESLSGNGTFRMNTDIASHTGDMLNVTGNASGNFVLDIRNTGLEPVSAGTPLQVVHTGSGDAAFSLNGGKVDAGTWEYYLNKENTDWYLKADSSQPGTDNPGTDNPGTDNPVPPVRHTTKSADAVLDMATAPVYVFNSELQSLRFRHGDVMQNTRSPGGVWGRYTGSDTRISGGAGSGYSLTQSGMETGGDTVFDLNDSRLAVGAFVSYTDNSISHNRGGSSTVGSTGGGLYATWFNNDGYYVDGVIKVNRFRNELRTWMSDGTAVKGDYHQNGFGGSLEAGRTFSLNENTWIQPYLRSTAFRAESKDISLDNGMKAKAGTTKSLQGEVGVNLGMNLDVAGTVVRPYLTTAVSHEFSDNNRVRINASYNFTNDISGTTGKYGAGVSAQLTANAGVWAEASYQNGENTESPVTGSVGFRINF
ncbi:autotransporter outer membrane beta-barrel domain-containing protein [Escherichia coli]|uniref:autotransporter outer membrane beta-barrel domain-containing protein n=4 Tax=Escherichia coli TaxID=562 RepID=UPI0007A63A4F|nr:autotransporter outer membrane beta-barrel domain-containing protein [Escherichia coli]EFC1674626.1 autotransporter outer membrane beta-barrel domain-containing protein [Escherichia coli]EFC9544158.1 autotransporter outer membrane beta-barrel domain-containing protein [Escherichia coli]EFH9778757.1 autotransporter outer membrane beta-barrel domain-containing protein [Escherichia coli]EFO5047016.1 autotransporter outer membrane beta-barrel domain-containing protein [Escherichia coli]EFT15216